MAENSSQSSPPKKRKWPKRCLWVFTILVALLWVINGPVARKAAHYGINYALANQGMTGDCTVKGTLAHGFTITDFDYIGSAGLQKIQVAKVDADYRLLRELIHGKIRSASISNAIIILDIDKFVSSENKEESQTKIKDTLKLIRRWLYQPEITLSEIELTLLKSENLLAHFTLGQLHHATNSNTYQLTHFQASDRSERSTPVQDVTLTWNDGSIDLTRLEVLPEIAINSAHFNWQNHLFGNANLQFLSATLDIDVDTTINAELTSGYLDAETIQQRFAIELPLDFKLNHIEATFHNWLAPMQNWEITCALDLPNISYQDYLAENTRLEFNQQNASYQLDLITNFKSAPISLKLDGKWLTPDADAWWESTDANYQLDCPRTADIQQLIPQLPQQIDLAETSIKLNGSTALKDLELQHLDAKLVLDKVKVGEKFLPQLKAKGNYLHKTHGEIICSFEQGDDSPVNAKASYSFEEDSYQIGLDIDESNPDWINAILKTFDLNVALQSPLKLDWQGTGRPNLEHAQHGSINIESLHVEAPNDLLFDLETQAEYHWPESLKLTTFKLREEDFLATAILEWDGSLLKIHQGSIHKSDKAIATLTAEIPYSPEITSLEKFLQQDTKWLLDLDIQPLRIQKINEWLQLHHIKQIADLTGTVALGLDLVGSPSSPDIKGYTKLENLRGIANEDLAPLHMLGEFASADQQLSFTGELLENTTQRAELHATIPFTPLEWAEQADDITAILQNTEVKGALKIHTLPLDRAARFVPQLKTIKGTLDGDAVISGNLTDPKVQLDTTIDIPIIVIEGDSFDDIKNIKIDLKANTDRQVEAKLNASVNGAQLESNATADLSDFKNPEFDVSLKASHAMVFRNDMVSIRANADLRLAGSLEDATLSGSIGIVESLFYKDIDLLPIGVPSSEVAAVKLPSLNSQIISNEFDIPEPFNSWKLDLGLRFEDPLLIRGNIAGGEIAGGVKASGTLATPKLDGAITANKVIARLPFSQLRIDKGQLEFSAKDGIIPNIDIQGSSTVSNYDVSIFLYGSASKPKATLTSFPPLPPQDILTLLATGVTASGLSNNTGAATLRAAQLFLIKLKQESGSARETAVIEKLIGLLQEFEFNIDQTDGFTGRQYSSARVKLTDRFYLSAQIDDKNQTRGLLLYVLRFR
ncbi:translocation/assembly module TamB domain-containing protein [Rubritalea spongiae]|uniref:Translocation/assembly module TamB domain-containing protein n=1 Tax=Rubritalea spongiae TaxID=430797 RepID=A0ABW5E5B8_9BACT